MDKLNNIDAFFRAAREQQAVHSFDAVKAQFIASSMKLAENDPMKKKNSLSLKKWIMTFTAITSIIVALSWMYFTSATEQKSPTRTSNTKQESTSNSSSHQQVSTHFISPSKPSQTKVKTPFTPILDVITLEDAILDETPVFNTLFEATPVNKQFVLAPIFSDEEPLPKLTEKEIAFAEKTKKQLLKALNKRDKKEWAYIPAGSFPFKGATISCQAIFIYKTEISNAQYLAFIYDLILQGRKADYLLAKPNQKLWPTFFKADSFEPWQSNYFHHPAYQSHPVVNITVEGAELFCDWLNTEYKKAYPKPEDAINNVRLPQEAEWTMAASCIGKYEKYPWSGQHTRNTEGLYFSNYRNTDQQQKWDTAYAGTYSITAPVKSYFPNDFGIYNLAGNVAEWVILSSNQKGMQKAVSPIQYRTIGGSFNNTETFLEINASDPFEGESAAPAIGFRIVMTHLGPNVR